MDNSVIERIENNFINIYNKFDILDKKINNYHMKFHKINEMIDIVISEDEYIKIYKTYFPTKNYDLMQDRFFIYNAVIDIPLKANTFIIFDYIFNSEYINIPIVNNLKIDVLEKNFNIHLKEYNKIRHVFKLDYNIIKINFYLYLYNNEIYNDEKMEYLKKILFNNEKI